MMRAKEFIYETDVNDKIDQPKQTQQPELPFGKAAGIPLDQHDMTQPKEIEPFDPLKFIAQLPVPAPKGKTQSQSSAGVSQKPVQSKINPADQYKAWMNQDQTMKPQDRGKLQNTVNQHFDDPENMDKALSSTDSLHNSWLLHQHMDTNPKAQQRFLDAMRAADPQGTNPSIQSRAQFLQDRINVNNEVRRLHSENPGGYKDAYGNPITGDPVQAVRDTSKFPNADFPFQSRADALSGARQQNPLLYQAVTNTNALTQPSYASSWPDIQ
jgi:hypothetical protein